MNTVFGMRNRYVGRLATAEFKKGSQPSNIIQHYVFQHAGALGSNPPMAYATSVQFALTAFCTYTQ